MNDNDFKIKVTESLTNIEATLPHLSTKEEAGRIKGLTELNKQRLGNHKAMFVLLFVTYLPLLAGFIYKIALGSN